jgi:choline monooxygenase
MFVNKSRLEHLLPPSAYYAPEQHHRELDSLFEPAWHLIACRSDLPKSGDFITFDLFGHPLLLRNFDGDLRCFINVCAHRHSMLTHERRGHAPRLVCQYHGWEYTKDGRTGRIPDARCFRPWDRENAHLTTVRTEICGELVFVCLAPQAPSLTDHLGSYWTLFASSFSPPYRAAWTYDASYAANWKVFVENSLESYHLPVVHPKTFGKLPPEANCEHGLDARFTWYRAHDDELAPLAWVAERFGVPSTRTYEHHNLHPNITYSQSDCVRLIMSVFPTSPTTCRHQAWLFTVRGERPGWIKEGFGWLLARAISRFASKVVQEDVGIYPDVQRGMEASSARGVIGTREERVYVFQKYVLDGCADRQHAAHASR